MAILGKEGKILGLETRARVSCMRWVNVLFVIAFAVTVIPAWAVAVNIPDGNAIFDDGGIRPDGLLKWKTAVSGGGSRWPAEADGKIFAIDINPGGQAVRAFDAVSGKEIWNFTHVNNIHFEPGAPEVDGGVVYVSGYRTSGYNLYAIDAATGAEIWNTSRVINGGYMWQPVCSDGMLYLTGINLTLTDTRFYVVSAATGTEIWNCSLKYGGVPGRPIVSGGVAYVSSVTSVNSSLNFTLYAIDLTTRNERWNKTGYDVPVAANGAVYAVRQPVSSPVNSSLSALNITDGHIIWDFPLPGFIIRNSVVANGDIYIIGLAEDFSKLCLYRMDASTGTQIWNQVTVPPSDVFEYGISYANGIIYSYFLITSPYTFNLRATDAVTGSELWKFAAPPPGTAPPGGYISSPPVANGSVYISCGSLYALGIPAAAFHANNLHTGVSGSRGAHPLDDLLWKYQTGGPVRSSPAVMTGNVYIGSDDGNLYSFDAGSGSRRWNFMTGGPVRSSPAVYADTVFIGSSDGKVYSLFASNGTKKWEYATGGAVDSSPVVAGGLVFAGSADHRVYALNVMDGTKKWDFLADSPIDSSPAAAFNDTGLKVFATSRNGTIYVLNATTGTRFWSGTPQGGGGNPTSPSVSTDSGNKGFPYLVVFGSSDGNVNIFDPGTGANTTYATGGNVSSTPAVKDGTAYVGSADGFVYSLDLNIRTMNWRHGTGGPVASSPALADGVVYVGSDDHHLYAIDSETGAEVWTYLTGGNVTSSPAVANGVVYVGSDDGSVYAIGRLNPPRVDTISPSSGVRGTTVAVTSLTGENFQVGDTVVLEGAGCPEIPMTDIMYSPTRITGTFVIPDTAPAGYRNVTVTNSAGEPGIGVNAFRVTNPAPVVTSINPRKHRHGGKMFTVAVAGNGFQPGVPGTGLILWKTAMTKNITASNVTVQTASGLSGQFQIPKKAKTGTYKVTVFNPDGQSGTKSNGFKILT